jgi:Spy/CpxP family protein refolding chaperone
VACLVLKKENIMDSKRILAFLLLVWLVFPAPAGSQEAPQGRWWRWPRVADRLSLTEAQKHQLDDKFFANRRQLIELKGTVEREQLELQRLLEKDPVDEAAVTTQFKNLDVARSKLAQERFRFIIEVRKVLGVERFRHLEAMVGQFKRKMLRNTLDQVDADRNRDDGGGNGTGRREGRRRWFRQ